MTYSSGMAVQEMIREVLVLVSDTDTAVATVGTDMK